METLIIENVDKKKASLLKELALQLGLKAKSTPVERKKQIKDSGVVTNPEILKRIKDYETGKSKMISLKEFEKIALKRLSNA